MTRFTIVADVPAGEVIRFVERSAGTVSCLDGPLARVEFDHDESTLAEAIALGIRELEAMGLRPVRIDDWDWVTRGEIADRIGRMDLIHDLLDPPD